jgi:hypothetical protein
MKKLSFGLLFAFFFSCSDNKTTTTTTEEGSATTAPVENVNGNIPDTTNGVSPSTMTQTPDSTHLKDSARDLKDSTKK